MADTAQNKCCTSLACAREAFQTDSVCDRGSVDTDAFIDFPICALIDPTQPETATPQADYPVIPFTPPPCACINIDYAVVKKEIEDRDDIYLKVDFKSIGDCCEGNYETDIDLRIPCIPFTIDGGSDSTPIDIEADCTISSPEGTFTLGLEVEDCTIAIDPKISIRIPKPKDLSFEVETETETAECFDDPTASFEIEDTSDPENCTRLVKGKLHVAFPHVANIVVCDAAEGETEGYGIELTGDLGGSAKFDMGVEEDSCGFATGLCPKIELNLPCPVKGEDAVITAKVGWGSGGGSDSATVAKVSEDSCAVEFAPADLNLEIPCPVTGTDVTLNARIGWGDGGNTGTAVLATVDTESCAIEGLEADLNLELPCPLDSLQLFGDDPGEGPYINVSKAGGGEGCAAAWHINLVLPDWGSSSSSSSESSSSRSSSGSSGSYRPESSDSSASSQESSSGGSGSDSPLPATASFEAVTGVECSEGGGINVELSTFTIDFDNHTVTSEKNSSARSARSEELARKLLIAAVKAINDDPSILDVVTDPYSQRAGAALGKLGLQDVFAEDGDWSEDDERIEDII